MTHQISNAAGAVAFEELNLNEAVQERDGPSSSCAIRAISPKVTWPSDFEKCSNRLLSKRDVLALEGGRRDGIYVVARGVLKLSKSLSDGRTQIVAMRYPGDILTTRVTEKSWFATVEVIEDAILYHFEDADVEKRVQGDPEFSGMWAVQSTKEITEAHEHLLTLGRKTPTERLACFLLKLGEIECLCSEGGKAVRVPMTRDEIGDFLGLESETVSRQFTRLKAVGLIHMTSPSIIRVRDRAVLSNIANGEPMPLSST